MTTTTYAEFHQDTEALEAAQAFSESVKGKTILVVGVNQLGIGFTTAEAFASQNPAHLIVAGRNTTKLQESVDALKQKYPDVDYRLLQLDLSDQKAIRASAAGLLRWDDVPVLDIIVNSAAIMFVPQLEFDAAGIEKTFATNHIGHFLFTNLVMPKLQRAAESNPVGATRVINVSSLSPTVSSMRWSDMGFQKVNKTLPPEEQPAYEMLKLFGVVDPEEQTYISVEAYAQSKVANTLFSIGLNDRLYHKYGILSLSCHPGVIRTELGRSASSVIMTATQKLLADDSMFHRKTLGAGSSTTVTIALDPKLSLPVTNPDENKVNYGIFFSDCQINDKVTKGASSNSEADRLWKYSEELVQQKFSF